MKGLSLGAVLAMIVSFVTNHSIFWAIFHGICGWFYIFYYIAVYVMHVFRPLLFSDFIGLFR